MKASVVSAYGGPEVMKYQDMPDPKSGAGDILAKVAGIGINPEDMLERNGVLRDQYPLHFPAIIGLDVSGTVVATGDGVTDLKVGDRVCGWSYHTYAELVADKADSFCQGASDDWTWSRRPRSRSWASAFATIPQVGIVANAIRGKAATDLLAKVRDGGTFASVTGEPDGSKPTQRCASSRSPQSKTERASPSSPIRKTGKMTIPIGCREELKNAGAAPAAFTKGGIGKVLLVP
jgi:hypothetical protein